MSGLSCRGKRPVDPEADIGETTASYAEQRRLSDRHFCWQAGLIWAAAHETRIGAYDVPPRLNAEVQALGYRASEFEAILSALDESKPTPDLIKEALAAMRRK